MKQLIILLPLILFGCNKDGIKIQTTDNPEFEVTLLFENDGCNVYRFRDGGNSHYYTNCSGQTMSRKSCGKNCSREENISGGRQ